MDDGGVPAEEPDFKHIPLQDRCVDKVTRSLPG